VPDGCVPKARFSLSGPAGFEDMDRRQGKRDDARAEFSGITSMSRRRFERICSVER